MANNVEIHIPVPEDAFSPIFNITHGNGKISYNSEKNNIIWKMA